MDTDAIKRKADDGIIAESAQTPEPRRDGRCEAKADMKICCAPFITQALLFLAVFSAAAQTDRVVLIEEFVETACSACAQYDSAFQALTKANEDKIAVINFHCHYSLDPFYTFNKSCDKRMELYGFSGFPSAMMNGMEPSKGSSHLSYVKQPNIDRLYNQKPLLEFKIKSSSAGGDSAHTAYIKVNIKALEDVPGKDLRVYVVVTENNINYEKRYGAKSVNGINEFNHIMRAMLPSSEGTVVGAMQKGMTAYVNVTFTNDDKEINYEEVRIVAFVQDNETKEVYGAAVTKDHPFR